MIKIALLIILRSFFENELFRIFLPALGNLILDIGIRGDVWGPPYTHKTAFSHLNWRSRHLNLHSISSPLQKPQRKTSLAEFCGAWLSPTQKYSSHFIITANIHVILVIRQIFYIKPESRNFNFSTIKLSPHKLSPHLRNITFHIFIRRKKWEKFFVLW